MISLAIGNEYLDLKPKTKIRYEIRNPLFDAEAIPGIYTYPISLPWTDKNGRLLGFPQLLFNRKALQNNIPCKIYIGRTLWVNGKIAVLPSGSKEFRISISGTSANLQESFSASIKDLELGGLRVLGTDTATVLAHAKLTAQEGSEKHDYVFFPIFNPDFYKDQPDYIGIVNFWNIGQQKFEVTNIYDESRSLTGQTVRGFSNMVPFPFLIYVLKQAFYEAGYTVTGNWLADSEISQLVFYNNQSIDAEYNSIGKTYTPKNSFSIADHLPEMTIAELLVSLKNMFGLVYIFDQESKHCTIHTVKEVITAKAENWTTKKIAPHIGVPESFKYNYRQLVALRDKTDTKTNYLEELDLSTYNVKGEVNTIADLPNNPGAFDLLYVKLNNQYWLAMPDPISFTPSWELLGERTEPFIIGNGSEDLITKFSTFGSPIAPFNLAYISYWFGYDLVPEVHQLGYSEVFTVEPEPVPFSPRLLFYRGMQTAEYDGGTNELPFGTHHVYAPNYSRKFNRSLSFYGEFGLYNTAWKEWLNFLKSAKIFTVTAKPTISDLLNLNLATPKKLVETTAIISNISGTISSDGIEPATNEMYAG
jgi:hypothetical protein